MTERDCESCHRARDAALGVRTVRRRVTLLGSRFVFADDWYRWNRWENFGAGINFVPSEAMEFSAVAIPVDPNRYEYR